MERLLQTIPTVSGTSALTVADAGDIPTGIVASLRGQEFDRTDIEYETGVAATDVIDRVPDTIR